MAYPTTDWPTATDAALTRVNGADIVEDDDFNYPDKQIRRIQAWLGANGEIIGDDGTAARGPGGLASPIADGGTAITLAAKKDFTAGKILSVGDNNDVAYSEKLAVDFEGKITGAGIRLGATVAVTSILDDDTMAADSDVALATQQSIKAYVDGSGYWGRSGSTVSPATAGDVISAVGSGTTQSISTERTDTHGDAAGAGVDIGVLTFRGRDSAGALAIYGYASSTAMDDTAGTESGKISLAVANGVTGAVDVVTTVTPDGSFTDPGHYDKRQTVTSAANAVAIDVQAGFNIYHVLTENTTFGDPSNPEDGMIIRIMIYQSDGSGHTVAWHANYKTSGAVAPASGEAITVHFEYNSTLTYWIEVARGLAIVAAV